MNSGLIQKGGTLTSLTNSGQQWDSPNAWSPLQWFLVEGLLNVDTAESRQMASQLVAVWLDANLIGWKKYKNMNEKYNAFFPGEPGSGGEYAPEIGFGWTNGVALDFIMQQSKGGFGS